MNRFTRPLLTAWFLAMVLGFTTPATAQVPLAVDDDYWEEGYWDPDRGDRYERYGDYYESYTDYYEDYVDAANAFDDDSEYDFYDFYDDDFDDDYAYRYPADAPIFPYAPYSSWYGWGW